MRGTNAIRKLDKSDGTNLQFHETFTTVQGEGPFSGMPAVFVRLSGCHLACTFCDTEWSDANDPVWDVEDIAGEMSTLWHGHMDNRSGYNPLFVLTGGEPTRVELQPLIKALLNNEPNAVIQIETSGSFWQSIMGHPNVSTVVSPKTPFVNPQVEMIACAYKYVIRASDRFHPHCGTPLNSTQIENGPLVGLAVPAKHLRRDQIYLSPCDEQDEAKNAANRAACVDIAMKHGYRVQLQIHKYLGLT